MLRHRKKKKGFFFPKLLANIVKVREHYEKMLFLLEPFPAEY